MPRKQEGITTPIRYKIKAYAVAMGITGGNERLAEEYADALAQSRALGIGVYRVAYKEIKPLLMKLEVPSALHGLYKAFINELISKVQRRRIATIDEIVDKWSKMGLDPAVLREVAGALVEIITEEVPTTPEKVG